MHQLPTSINHTYLISDNQQKQNKTNNMKDEIINLIRLSIIIVVALSYCYFISSRIPKGNLRLISLLPVIAIFTFIPLFVTPVLLQFYFGLSIAWLASFKLLLFAFARDDTLSINPSMSLFHFIVLNTLPVKIKPKEQNPSSKSSLTTVISRSWMNLVMWCVMIGLYVNYKQHSPVTNPVIILSLYTGRFFFGIQFFFQFLGAMAMFLLSEEIDTQFNDPHRPTSVQDFWGKRWNLMFSGALKSTVYEPTRCLFKLILGRRWALHPAIVITFAISGLMHELVYFYVGRQKPTWQVTWYLLIQGIWVAIEIEVKKKASESGWKLHPNISTLLAAGFISVTTIWLDFPELIQCGADEREINEYIAFGDYIKRIVHIG